MSEIYDLVIIGAGSGGLTAADFAAQLGVRVALVEKHRVGGDCTWTGCVPSKSLRQAAKVAHEMSTASRYGLSLVESKVDLNPVMDRVRAVIDEVYQEESPEALRAVGIDVYLGAARFIDPHTIVAGDATLSARHIVLATGAHPFVPPISGLTDTDYITYEGIWDLDVLPEHLVVVGAGPVGCEMAQAFRRLGSEVTLLSSHDRLLLRDDAAASRVIGDVFEKEGIRVIYRARVDRAWQDNAGIHVAAGSTDVVGDKLLIAAGRRPNVEGIDLDKAGVAFDQAGIEVDDVLRTSQQHIYAVGDCTGGPQFTHYAGWQAAMAVRNALLPGAAKGVMEQVPWTTFTDPEVAHVGLTEEQARRSVGEQIMIYDWPMTQVDRARADGDTDGFLRLVHK